MMKSKVERVSITWRRRKDYPNDEVWYARRNGWQCYVIRWPGKYFASVSRGQSEVALASTFRSRRRAMDAAFDAATMGKVIAR